MTLTIVLSTIYIAIAGLFAFWSLKYRNSHEHKNAVFVDSKAKMLVKCAFWIFYIIHGLIELFLDYEKETKKSSKTQPQPIPDNNKKKKNKPTIHVRIQDMEKKYKFHNHHERTRRDKFNNLIKIDRKGNIYSIKCNACGSWLSVKAHKAHIMDKNMEIGVVCNFCVHFNKIDLENPFKVLSPEEIELEKQNTINSIRGFIDL